VIKVDCIKPIGLKLSSALLLAQPFAFETGAPTGNSVKVRMEAFWIPLVAAKPH
jgi:hypothetical protein